MVPAVAHSATMNNYFIRYKQLIIDLIVVTNLKPLVDMPDVLSIEDREKIASRYKVFQSVVPVQSWWRTVKGANESLNEKTIKNCHRKLL